MKSLLPIFALTGMLFAAPPATTSTTPDAVALLKQSDQFRNAWPSFITKLKISNFETGKQDEQHDYLVYNKGGEKIYVDFQSPQEKGRHLLMLADDMWIYLPDTSRAVRITPLQRLTGNASNGDVARTNYAADYDATYLRNETVDGIDCHVLELQAKRKGATYHKIDYWLRAGTARPVKADLFVISGKKIKSTTFDQYQEVGGYTVIKQMTIQDDIRKNSRSVIEYLQFTPRDLPDKMFHQSRAGDL
jgi:outer membrane lipoprotein-sorting protein